MRRRAGLVKGDGRAKRERGLITMAILAPSGVWGRGAWARPFACVSGRESGWWYKGPFVFSLNLPVWIGRQNVKPSPWGADGGHADDQHTHAPHADTPCAQQAMRYALIRYALAWVGMGGEGGSVGYGQSIGGKGDDRPQHGAAAYRDCSCA